MPRTKESQPLFTSVGGFFKRCWEVVGFPFNFVAKGVVESFEQSANWLNMIHAWFINVGGSVGRILRFDEGWKAAYENIKKGSDFFGEMLFKIPKHFARSANDITGDIASQSSATVSPTQQFAEHSRDSHVAKDAAKLDDRVKTFIEKPSSAPSVVSCQNVSGAVNLNAESFVVSHDTGRSA